MEELLLLFLFLLIFFLLLILVLIFLLLFFLVETMVLVILVPLGPSPRLLPTELPLSLFSHSVLFPSIGYISSVPLQTGPRGQQGPLACRLLTGTDLAILSTTG
uniref:Uncharacterized protein n=1 Tax=Cacopsylla melanoneura TaxID=428564 RepID=A0A8D8LXZ3_9HEMI